MNKDDLITVIEHDCPLCNKTHLLEQRRRQTQTMIKGETVQYEEIYFLCPVSTEEENEFVSAGLMDENLLKARDSYRMKKGLLTAKEIASIRSYYGLTQSDFSAVLGWGEVTVTRYESKSIQDETYDNIMRMVFDNPMFALECLDRHKSKFTKDRYVRIRKNIVQKVETGARLYLKKQEICSLYVNFEEESDFNGNKLLDIDKVGKVVGYFSQFVDNLYKVKLMKLLWYSDFIFYGRHGKSMTGLVYRHMPLGALPIGYNEITELPTIRIEEELICEDIGYKIKPNEVVDLSVFSVDEVSVLAEVAAVFKNFTAKEIIEYMHKEKAYTETIYNQIIPYSLATQLNELR